MAGRQANFAAIEQLTQETSGAKQRELLDAITDIFLVTVQDQSEDDNETLSGVMERIAYTLDTGARAQLAGRIADSDRVSHSLVSRLANDDISVAGPVLERSGVLRDADLIEIIRTRPPEHLHSIAGRKSIAAEVCGALVEHGDGDTLSRLSGNRSADIPEAALGAMAERAKNAPGLAETLEARSDVPDAPTQRDNPQAAGLAKPELAQSKPGADDKFVAALIERCVDTIELKYSGQSVSEIDRLHKMDAITEEVVAHYARARRVPELVYCLSLLTGLDDWSVSQCLLKAELPALAILCKANKLKSTTFLLLAENRSDGKGRSSKLSRAMRDYEALPTAIAGRIMRSLKHGLQLNREKAANASRKGAQGMAGAA